MFHVSARSAWPSRSNGASSGRPSPSSTPTSSSGAAPSFRAFRHQVTDSPATTSGGSADRDSASRGAATGTSVVVTSKMRPSDTRMNSTGVPHSMSLLPAKIALRASASAASTGKPAATAS